jgi:hypothetical protein
MLKRSWLKRGKSVLKRSWIKRKPLLKKPSKYGNASCKCWLGHIHDSVWEAAVCNYLYSLAKNKRIKGYITQKSIDLIVKGTTICQHIVDFYVITNDNRKLFVEAKGFGNPVWIIKRKLTETLYPKIKYLTIYRGGLGLIDKEIDKSNKYDIL